MIGVIFGLKNQLVRSMQRRRDAYLDSDAIREQSDFVVRVRFSIDISAHRGREVRSEGVEIQELRLGIWLLAFWGCRINICRLALLDPVALESLFEVTHLGL